MREIRVYVKYYITLSLGIIYVMLRTSENFHAALVPFSFLGIYFDEPFITLAMRLVWLPCSYKMWDQLANRI
jgi:hypothetical protein